MEKTFTADAAVEAKETQTLTLSWPWANPRLWDVGQPNLYTLRLKVKGAGLDDEYNQEFGFREFWVEGRKFFLNGTEIRLRQGCFYWGSARRSGRISGRWETRPWIPAAMPPTRDRTSTTPTARDTWRRCMSSTSAST